MSPTRPVRQFLIDAWMVRTHQNILSGPFTRSQVRDLIQKGSLHLRDEVCVANHYWIYLHERDEVVDQLGADVLPSLFEGEGDQTPTHSVGPERATKTLTVGQNAHAPLAHHPVSRVEPPGAFLRERLNWVKGGIWILLSLASLMILLVLRLLHDPS